MSWSQMNCVSYSKLKIALRAYVCPKRSGDPPCIKNWCGIQKLAVKNNSQNCKTNILKFLFCVCLSLSCLITSLVSE